LAVSSHTLSVQPQYRCYCFPSIDGYLLNEGIGGFLDQASTLDCVSSGQYLWSKRICDSYTLGIHTDSQTVPIPKHIKLSEKPPCAYLFHSVRSYVSKPRQQGLATHVIPNHSLHWRLGLGENITLYVSISASVWRELHGTARLQYHRVVIGLLENLWAEFQNLANSKHLIVVNANDGGDI
jgi:hypothetical protein